MFSANVTDPGDLRKTCAKQGTVTVECVLLLLTVCSALDAPVVGWGRFRRSRYRGSGMFVICLWVGQRDQAQVAEGLEDCNWVVVSQVGSTPNRRNGAVQTIAKMYLVGSPPMMETGVMASVSIESRIGASRTRPLLRWPLHCPIR